MTRHKHTHTGLVTPSPLDRWIDATLRLFAMLVQTVAATLRMIPRRGPVIGTQAMPMALPRETHDISKEPQAVPQDSSPISAHAEQRSFAARPSKHERGLTVMSHTSSSPSVSLTSSAIHLPLLRMGRQTALRRLRLRGIASLSAKHWGRWQSAQRTDGGGKPRTLLSPLVPTQVGTQSIKGDVRSNRAAPAALDPGLRRDER